MYRECSRKKIKNEQELQKGGCIIICAEGIVICLQRVRAYHIFTKLYIEKKRSRNLEKSGQNVPYSKGLMPIQIPTPTSLTPLEVDVVRSNIPFIF